MLNEEVRNIMTKEPVVVSPEASLKELTDLMTEKKWQQVPVVDGIEFKGLVTAYDLWKAGDLDNKKVKDIMTTKVIKITPIDKVGTAAELFMDKRFKTLPVVNLRNELKGVVTAFDVIRHVMRREYSPEKTLYPEVLQ
jgi:CBS domain-containing protein